MKFNEVGLRIEAVQAQLGKGRITVAREGAMLNHEFRPPSLRPVKRDEQQVQVDRQGVHGDHLHGTGADDVG